MAWLGATLSSWDGVSSACSVSALYLFSVWMGGCGLGVPAAAGFFFLGTVFFVLALIHGFSVLGLCLSLSLAVPYLSSPAGHLLESAACSWSFFGSV